MSEIPHTTQHLSRTPGTTKHCPNTEHQTHPNATRTRSKAKHRTTQQTRTRDLFSKNKHCSLPGTRTATCMQLDIYVGFYQILIVDRDFQIVFCPCHGPRGIVASVILIVNRVRESSLVHRVSWFFLYWHFGTSTLVYTLSPFRLFGRCHRRYSISW